MSPPRPVPSGRSLRPVVLALVATLLVAAAVPGVGAARAPPDPVCDLCTDGALADAAADHGVAVGVGGTSLGIHLRADGTTRRVARLGLTDGAEELRNESVRRAVVADALGGRANDVSSRLNGDTLVVEYRRGGVATRESGAVVVTAFHAAGAPPLTMGGEGTAVLGADELVVYAPAGHVPAGGIDRDARPTFVRDDAAFPEIRGAVARLLVGI